MVPPPTCQNCGEGLAFEDAYCPSCGTQVADQDRPALASRRQKLSDSSLVDGKCRSCNGPLRSTDVFCPECGARRSPTTGSPSDQGSASWRRLRERLEEVASEDYEILEELGRGGMGAVYLARERALDRPVAIKVLFPRFLADDSMLERFRNEARIVAALRHPSIVGVHAVRHLEDLHFFVMNYIEGASLEKVVRTHGPLPVSVVKAVLYQVGSALAYAHRQGRGVIHRDIKPSNIMLDSEGTAILTDFGISKAVNRSQGLTMTGAIIGTPEYMSPEQCRGDTLTTSSDQYSLGLVGYSMLTGRPPFSGPHYAVLLAHLQETPPSIREVRPDCPDDLEHAVLTMLAKVPNQRFTDVREGLRASGGRAVEHGDPVRQEIAELVRAAGGSRWRAASVAEVSISHPPRVVLPGDQFVLEAVPMDELGQELPDRDIVWTSTDPGVVSIWEDGSFRAVSEGRAFLRAVCEGREAQVEVVVDRAAVAELRVTPGPDELRPGDRFTLEATPLRSDGKALTGREVSWASSDPAVAFVTSGGSVEAVGPGRTVVTAECEGRRAAVEVDVLPPAVARLWLSEPPSLLHPGHEFGLDVAVLDRKGVRLEDRQVTWEVRPRGVVQALGEGRFRAVSEGEAEIVARCEGREVSGRVSIRPEPRATVIAPAPDHTSKPDPEGVPTILRPSVSAPLPEERPVGRGADEGEAPDAERTSRTPPDGPPRERTVAFRSLSEPPRVGRRERGRRRAQTEEAPAASRQKSPGWWASPVLWLGLVGVAAVTAVGVVVLGDGDGGGGGGTGTTGAAATVDVSAPLAQIAVGDSTRLLAVVRSADGEPLSGASLTWSLGGADQGDVELRQDGTVVARGPGTVTVTARSGDARGSARITVVDLAGPDSLTAGPDEPPDVRLAAVALRGDRSGAIVGAQRRLTVTALGSDGSPWLFGSGEVAWRSSNRSVVTVSGGLVRAVGPGSAWVVATLDGVSDSVRLQIAAAQVQEPPETPPRDPPVDPPPVPAEVVIRGAPPSLATGEAVRLTGTVRDAGGAELEVPVTWSSSRPDVLAVDAGSGVVEGRSAGSAVVVATAGSLADSVPIAVTAPAGASEPTVEEAAAAAAEWARIVGARDADRMQALIGTVDGDHGELLRLIREDSRELRAGTPENVRITEVDGERATVTFVLPLTWRSNFGREENRRPAFRAGLAWQDGAWALTSCRLVTGMTP